MTRILPETLQAHAAERPDARALVFLDDGERVATDLTYAELDAEARIVARALIGATEPGDRVLLIHQPGARFIIDFLGCHYADVVPVPIYPPIGHREIATGQRIAELTAPRAVLTDLGELCADIAPDVPRIDSQVSMPDCAPDRRDSGPDHLALIQYTSGSTGDPKGVMVTHANLAANHALTHTRYRQPEEHVVIVSWLPLYHDMGLIGCSLYSLYTGGTAVLMSPLAFLQRPIRWLRAIETFQAHGTAAPNFAFELSVRRVSPDEVATLDLSCLRTALCGAEPIRWNTLERFAEHFGAAGISMDNFSPAYGLAEATLLVTGTQTGTAARACRVPHNEDHQYESYAVSNGVAENVVIVNGDATPAPDDEIGEIWVHGDSVAAGYWGDEERTEETFGARIPGSEKRYLRTGDLGFVNHGELFVVGRLKDLLIVGGRNHYPSDLEQTVEQSSSDVRKGCVAVFQIDEDVVVAAETRNDVDIDELRRTVTLAVARDHGVQVADVHAMSAGSIPKTSSGKIRRSDTRHLYLEATRSASSS